MASLLRRIDLAELRAFCVAVELGSLGRAARLLRVSQPALSKRMRELEVLAGVPLLTRSARGVKPTAAGERLYAQARPLLTQAEHVEAVLSGLRAERTPIRLAASHTIAEHLLPEPLAEFQALEKDGISLELLAANSTVVHDLVREGRADFGIAAAEPGEGADDGEAPLQLTDLCEDEVIVAVSPAHPWAQLEAIPLQELRRTPMVMRDPSANTRRVVDAVLAEHGLALPTPLAEVGSTSAAIATAISAGAPALLSQLAATTADRQLVARRVEGLSFKRRFVMLWSAREALGPQARRLIDHLASALQQLRT